MSAEIAPEVDREPGGETNRGLALHERRQTFLELDVDIEGSVEEPRSGGAGPVFPQSLLGGFLDLGVIRQSQVVVGPQHDDPLAVHGDHRILARLDHAEVEIEPHLPHFFGVLEIIGLLKNVHSSPSVRRRRHHPFRAGVASLAHPTLQSIPPPACFGPLRE